MGLILCDPTVLSIRDLHLNSMSSIVVATYIYMQAVYINILVYTPQIHVPEQAASSGTALQALGSA